MRDKLGEGVVDADRLKQSWAHVAAYGDQVPLRFYGRLFVAHPEVRDMFPLGMATQRDRLVEALGLVVSGVDDLEQLTPFLHQLGRDHRKFGTRPEHFAPVGEALLATLADFLGEAWTADLAADWTAAYNAVAGAMVAAAAQAEAEHVPAWWDAEVVAHERRTFDIAVLALRPGQAYPYRAGQSIPVESELRPRVWRYYSPANAPRADGLIELHVRRAPGGALSSALVDQLQPGDVLHLGPPLGHRLVLGPSTGRPRLLIAGGTGLAPLKALVDQLGAEGAAGQPPVTLFVGVRTRREVYDLEALRAMEQAHPWLTVVPAVADEDADLHPHQCGPVGEVALRLVPDPADHEIAVCGSPAMVAATTDQLTKAGCPADRVHFEGFLGLLDELPGRAEQRENQP